MIPVFGFGDEMTGDHSVFTLSNDVLRKPGFPLEGIRARYREVVPNVVMAGPTSFAPIINEAVGIVNQTGEYHILVIIADGQVTRSVDIPAHAVSKNEKDTIDAITYARYGRALVLCRQPTCHVLTSCLLGCARLATSH